MGEDRETSSRVVVTEAMESAWKIFVERRPQELVIVGGAGFGKTTVLTWLADRLTRAGHQVVNGSRAEESVRADVMLLDEPIRLDGPLYGETLAEEAKGAARRTGAPTVIRTSRTMDRDQGGAAEGIVWVNLDLWIAEDVVEAVRVLRADSWDERDRGVTEVLENTEGIPWLVWEYLSGDGVQDTLVRRVLRILSRLTPFEIDILLALACDLPLSSAVSPVAAGSAPPGIDEALAALSTAGIITSSGRIPRIIRQITFEHAPQHRVQATVADALRTSHAKGVAVESDLAEDLVLTGVIDERLATTLERHGERAMAKAPARAVRLFTAALANGGSPARLHLRVAQAAARHGDLVEAQAALGRAQDAVPEALDEPALAEAMSVISARQGRSRVAADVWRRLVADRGSVDDEHADLAYLALVGVGAGHDAQAVLGNVRSIPTTPTAAVLREMASAVRDTLHGDAEVAVRRLLRASAELTVAQDAGFLPDHPATLAALLSLSVGDVRLARTALDSLRDGVGSPIDRERARALRAWLDLSSGHYDKAHEAVEAADAESAREQVWWSAIRLGLARRQDDLTGLTELWGHARSVLIATEVDLWNLIPLAELGIAAARLQESDLATPMWDSGRALLNGLGPSAWGPPFHWAGIQAGILASRPKALAPHAAALVSAARSSQHATVLAQAGRTWVAVLGRDVDRAAVVTAARGLASVSQSWEGARLAAHAAARAADRRDTAILLECARELRMTQSTAPAAWDDPARRGGDLPEGAIELTEREREVTELVIAGLTYREVASRLFLSAKTVEHHMARIKRRSGAETRSELLRRLAITFEARADDYRRERGE
jgi:DNA-binding NarL/FixJ family response regulator